MTMNVYIEKALKFLHAHKQCCIFSLLVLNIACLYITANSELTIYGRIETSEYRKSALSTLYKNDFNTRTVHSRIDDPNTDARSSCETYKYCAAKDNSFITLGLGESIAINHHRIFSVDENCALFFSGQHKFSMENISLRCFY